MIDTEELRRYANRPVMTDKVQNTIVAAADEIDRLRKMAEYAQHKPGCAAKTEYPPPDGYDLWTCTCGLAELLTDRSAGGGDGESECDKQIWTFEHTLRAIGLIKETDATEAHGTPLALAQHLARAALDRSAGGGDGESERQKQISGPWQMLRQLYEFANAQRRAVEAEFGEYDPKDLAVLHDVKAALDAQHAATEGNADG